MVDWQIRPFKEVDAAQIAALWTASFKADGLDIVITEDDMLHELARPGFDPLKQGLVVEGPPIDGLPDNMIPGGAAFFIIDDPEASERIYELQVIAHPAARPLGLERELALRMIDIARRREADPSAEPRAVVRLRAGFSPKQESQKKVYEDLGLQLRRTFWTMECPLDDLPEPQPIEGVRIRPMQLPEDILPSREALHNSFIDHYDFHPRTEEQWAHRLNTPDFRAAVSWVAEIEDAPGKLAGFCLCGVFEEENRSSGRAEGWIQTLGTIRGWRGKGLGRSLLLYGLHSLRDAGLKTGMLGVDSVNPTGATHLYESVGFRVRDTWLNYGCLLSEVKA